MLKLFCFVCLYVLLVEDTYHGSGKHILSAGDIFGVVLFCIANIEESEQSFLVSVNCLDRHVARNPSAVAIIWEKNEPGEQEEITYKYVRHFNAFCYSIYMMDVQKGMYVCILSDIRKLLDQTCQIANVLSDVGVKKGDKVMIYMPAMSLAVAAMLACARMGAVHW